MRLIAIVLILQVGAWGADYFVAPDGSDEAAGTITAPWSLTKMCRAARSGTPMNAVLPGDRVWFRGGSYYVAGEVFCEHIGTEEDPITLEAYPGEVPLIWTDKLTGGNLFTIGGSYQIVKGFRFYTTSQRVTFVPGSGSPVQAPALVNVSQQLLGAPTGNQIINCMGHDGTGFIAATESDIGTRYEGNIVFSMGRDAPDRLHGGPVYAQNDPAAAAEIHKHNVFLNNEWRFNYRLYKTTGALGNFEIDGNVIYGGDNFAYTIDAGEEIGPLTIKDVTVVWSKNTFNVGGGGNGTGTVTVEDSLFWNAATSGVTTGFYGQNIQNFTATGSTFLSMYALRLGSSKADPTFVLDDNDYYAQQIEGTNQNARYCVTGAGYTGRPHSAVDYPTYWPNLADPTHPEPNSTCQSGLPVTNWVKVYPNARETGRAHVAVVNFAGAATQSVDLSTVLTAGDRYEVIDLWNPLADAVASGVYVGSAVSLPLTGTALYHPGGDFSACWNVDRANCLTSGDFVVADVAGNLPAGMAVNQAAVLSSNYRLYYWSGSAWTDTGATLSTHAGPTYERVANAHAFLVRRLYDGRAETTLAWRGAVTDVIEAGYLKPDASITWGELPVTQIACTDGRCRAKVPQALGNAYWRINGGVTLKMAARGRETVPVAPGPLDSPWSADFSEDFGPGDAN